MARFDFDIEGLKGQECSIHVRGVFVVHGGPRPGALIQAVENEKGEREESPVAVPLMPCYFVGFEGDWLKIAYNDRGGHLMYALVPIADVASIHFVKESRVITP